MKKITIIVLLFSLVAIAEFLYIIRLRQQRNECMNADYSSARHNIIENLPIDTASAVFVGDSQTANFQLHEVINILNLKNRGVGRDTTGGVFKRLPHYAKQRPDKIFIQIGINDLRNGLSLDLALLNVSKSVDTIKALSPNTKVFIQGIFPCKEVGSKIIKYNAGLKDVAVKHGATFIDLYTPFNNNGKLKYDSGDGLHVNADGYTIWGKILKPYLLKSSDK